MHNRINTTNPIEQDIIKFSTSGIQSESRELVKAVSATVGKDSKINSASLGAIEILIFIFFLSIAKLSNPAITYDTPIPTISAFIPINCGKKKVKVFVCDDCGDEVQELWYGNDGNMY